MAHHTRLRQECTDSGRHDARATKFCTVAPNIVIVGLQYGMSLYVTLVAPINFW
jgi:hypothetical protein